MSDHAPTPPESGAPEPQTAPPQEGQARREAGGKRRAAGLWLWGGAAVLTLIAALLAFLSYSVLTARKPARKEAVQNALVFTVDGWDAKGRWAKFDFIILKSEFTWAKGSAEQIERHGQPIPAQEAAARVIDPNLAQLLRNEKALIAVGLASHEGERQTEEDRAEQRAQTIVSWLDGAADPATPVWRLNLGQYDKTCKAQEDADTSFERPVIVIGVGAMVAEGPDLREALVSAISDRPNLPGRSCYSRFDLTKVR